MTNLLERKKTLEGLIQRKVVEFQNIETLRNKLTTEIIELKGKVDLLNELIKEETQKDINNEVDNKK